MAPAPWAELEGKYMTFYLPSDQIRDLEDPAPALRFYDEVVSHKIRENEVKTTDWITGERGTGRTDWWIVRDRE